MDVVKDIKLVGKQMVHCRKAKQEDPIATSYFTLPLGAHTKSVSVQMMYSVAAQSSLHLSLNIWAMGTTYGPVIDSASQMKFRKSR